MTNKRVYDKRKALLLQDSTICRENRRIFDEFFVYEEYKLKRINGLNALDEATYKTLLEYCSRFRTVNKWFKNKPWKALTRDDIKRVYDDLEDGKTKSIRGTPFKNKKTYYNKIFKAKPFELAHKADLAREIIDAFGGSRKEDTEVRYIDIEAFRKLVDVAIQPIHKFLLWLAWDIGENVNSLLQLRKKDFYRQTDEETHDPEYRVNLSAIILKRSRRQRGEVTHFRETVSFADMILKGLDENDLVFPFQYRQAKKIFDRAAELTGIKCKPGNQKPSWKDLRSSMACHLLKSGWHSDEINARLGHQPSSKELNKYVNFLALDSHRPKKKLFDNTLNKVSTELENEKERGKLLGMRVDNQKSEIEGLKREMEKRREFDDILTELAEDPAVLRKAMQAMVKLSGQNTNSGR